MAEPAIQPTAVLGDVIWRQRARGAMSFVRRMPLVPTFVLSVLLISAIFAPFVAPHSPTKQNLSNALAPPMWQPGGSWQFPLGTDKLGRDVLSRVMHGARVSLSLSILVILMGGTAGTALGVLSGYMGGKTDAIIQRGVEAILSLPLILVALVFVFRFGSSFSSVIFILTPFLAARFIRMIRGESLSVRERDFIALSKVIGTPTYKIFYKHMLPNVFNTVIVVATLEVGHLILLESSLSFLGVGVPPPRPAWGLMIADGRDFIATKYWLSLFPGLAILGTVLSLNLFGDWLRDTFDPRRRQI